MNDTSAVSELTASQLSLLEKVTDQYDDDWRAGKKPNTQEIVAAYPELAPVLVGHLGVIERLYRAAPVLTPVAPDTTQKRQDLGATLLGADVPAGSVLEQPPSLARPETPCRYEIGRELGRGASATVHEAQDTSLNRAVAIKVFD